jgi:N-methylhydantoinase A
VPVPRLAVDTGGTFTDLVVADESGRLRLFKTHTIPDDPVRGVLNVLKAAAETMGVDLRELLVGADLLVHGTTRATNAILTKAQAKTAFLTTKGHRDILLWREGGRSDVFNFSRPYPEPYVPRRLTFEVPERIGVAGDIVVPLDEQAVGEICGRLRELEVEAVGVCLLWSIVNPANELRVGELLTKHLPGVPFTLSHQLNPTLREYRRASSACIDASLKPLMSEYLRSLQARLIDAGYERQVLLSTSAGDILPTAEVASAPIHSIASGPAMAPVAGRFFAELDAQASTAIISDAGGTSYDVTLVHRGRIPWTRETWLGEPYLGHMTGFPSVEVHSIGAGGGSIAAVDSGGLLHVGPQSAGSDPGPACYARGGTLPTVTDASLVLGYIDPDYFLGGGFHLDLALAARALENEVARRLGIPLHEAAAAVLSLATEHMVRAIEDITLRQGVDPREAVLVAGGGAAGLNAIAIARRLGCAQVIVPESGPALSAVGALLSELGRQFVSTFPTTSEQFDHDGVNDVLADLENQCREFVERAAVEATDLRIELAAEARYPHQIWELELPLASTRFHSQGDVDRLCEDFHNLHEQIFSFGDRAAPVQVIAWRARVRGRVGETAPIGPSPALEEPGRRRRSVYFEGLGSVHARVHRAAEMEVGANVTGPAIVETPLTTVVIEPGASVERCASGSLAVRVEPVGERELAALSVALPDA